MDDRILSESVRNFLYNGREMHGEALENATNRYMTSIYGQNWRADEQAYISQQEEVKETEKAASEEKPIIDKIEEIINEIPDDEEEALNAANYEFPDLTYEKIDELFKKAKKKKEHTEKLKSDPEYQAYEKLSPTDKKALEGLQKMDPKGGWTAEKFTKLMNT